MNKVLCKSVINPPLSNLNLTDSKGGGCDRKYILSSQVAFSSQILHAIAYSFTCGRTSESILPTKRAVRLISRLSSFPCSQLVWRKVVPARALGLFGCKQQCCSIFLCDRCRVRELGSPLLTEQSFREGSIRRRICWNTTFAGMDAWLLPRADTQFGFGSSPMGGFESRRDSLFPGIYHATALAPTAPTHQAFGLTQAPSQ